MPWVLMSVIAKAPDARATLSHERSGVGVRESPAIVVVSFPLEGKLPTTH